MSERERSEDKFESLKQHALKWLTRARQMGLTPTAALVSYDDAVGTELAYKPIEIDGVRVDSSRLVPSGKVFVDIV